MTFLDRLSDKALAVRLARRTRRMLREAGVAPLEKKPRFARGAPGDLGPWDIRITREGDGALALLWSAERAAADDTRALRSHAAAYLHYMRCAGPSATSLVFDISDGNEPSRADVSPSSFLPGRALVPDPRFFATGGHRAARAGRGANLPWEARASEIVWRGGLNGAGLHIADVGGASQSPLIAQRLRLALAARGLEGVDIRFVAEGQAATWLARHGLIGAPQPAALWRARKFAIDIDGFSNTWDNLFHRLLFGCCVLKVESEVGFRQWYYDRLIPWRHYVPVAADLSDLSDKVSWLHENDPEAHAIAQHGQALAESMTFESACAEAAETIARLCQG
ncbi:MAG: glycosyl transferase family 90 [Pseudomonadota bacterium]